MIIRSSKCGNIYVLSSADLFPRVDTRIKVLINEMDRNVLVGIIARAHHASPYIWDTFESYAVDDNHIIRAWSGSGRVYVGTNNQLRVQSFLPGSKHNKTPVYRPAAGEDLIIGAITLDFQGVDRFKRALHEHQPQSLRR